MKKCPSRVILLCRPMTAITKKKEKNYWTPLWVLKKYWSILNSFLGNKKMPNIPSLFENGEIVTDYSL